MGATGNGSGSATKTLSYTHDVPIRIAHRGDYIIAAVPGCPVHVPDGSSLKDNGSKRWFKVLPYTHDLPVGVTHNTRRDRAEAGQACPVHHPHTERSRCLVLPEDVGVAVTVEIGNTHDLPVGVTHNTRRDRAEAGQADR